MADIVITDNDAAINRALDAISCYYAATFGSNIVTAANRYLHGWLHHRTNTVNLDIFREAIDTFRRKHDHHRRNPPIRDIQDIYEKLLTRVKKVSNRTICSHCSNTGYAIYMQALVDSKSLPIQTIRNPQRVLVGGVVNIRKGDTFVKEEVTAAHLPRQALMPCICDAGVAYGRKCAESGDISKRTAKWLLENAWVLTIEANQFISRITQPPQPGETP